MSAGSPVTDEATPAAPATGDQASPVVPVLVGAAMVAIGVLLLTQVPAIRADGYGTQSPRFLPLAVISLWTVLSIVYLLRALLVLLRRSDALPAEQFGRLGRVSLLLVLLIGYAYTIDPLGYVPTTAVFFVGTARVLGSHHVKRDVVSAVLLATGIYLSFTELLNVRLPQGVMPF